MTERVESVTQTTFLGVDGKTINLVTGETKIEMEARKRGMSVADYLRLLNEQRAEDREERQRTHGG